MIDCVKGCEKVKSHENRELTIGFRNVANLVTFSGAMCSQQYLPSWAVERRTTSSTGHHVGKRPLTVGIPVKPTAGAQLLPSLEDTAATKKERCFHPATCCCLRDTGSR